MTIATNPQSDPRVIKAEIRDEALTLGFDAVGFTSAETKPQDIEALQQFVGGGYHGDMDWMARDDGRRGNPGALMESVKTVIVLGVNYGPGTDPMAVIRMPDRGAVSVYARGKDYHDIVKKRLKKLGRWIAETYGSDIKVFVDTAPVMEKPLAERAGIGWQGKHSNLVSRARGSWLFLGEVFLDIELPPDMPEPDHCGSCSACLSSCPTDAFPEPYVLDARRCISYLTIEHKGDIDDDLMDAMGNHIYGCDDCLAACPWTKFSVPTREPALEARVELTQPRLADLAKLDDAGFRQFFAGSPIKRTGRDRFVRNVLIAVGNSGDASLKPVAENLCGDASELVARAARRAVMRLSET
ncbi:MAG: tRNA epoxyqueuosine(34) reductase QueG [Rhodospirillales bacterium]|nr:tRNA epoxyqueuosine(34) reductase QueG [Rhodospirillales bacterium]MBO6785339.1 tRNA epoxyqueuosine(34) reductase QueG [Rhodospirillales bacterium]